MRRFLPVSALVMTIAGCSLLPSTVPAEVSGRTTLPACGQESTTRIGGYNLDARRCFWDAYLEGRPAEFISTRPTVEGDPVTFIYRVLAAETVEVFIDSTKDKWGSGAWARLRCRTLGSVDGSPITPDFGPDESCTETTIR